jgi:hypothetical protein
LNAEIVAGTASEAKNPAVRLGFGVLEGRDFFGPRIGKRKCVSWRFPLGFGVSGGQDFFGPRTIKRKCVSWRFSKKTPSRNGLGKGVIFSVKK